LWLKTENRLIAILIRCQKALVCIKLKRWLIGIFFIVVVLYELYVKEEKQTLIEICERSTNENK
jgi:hypothetical protein